MIMCFHNELFGLGIMHRAVIGHGGKAGGRPGKARGRPGEGRGRFKSRKDDMFDLIQPNKVRTL